MRRLDLITLFLFLNLFSILVFACDDEAPAPVCPESCPLLETCEPSVGRCLAADEVEVAWVDQRPSIAVDEEGRAFVSAYVSRTEDLVFGVYDAVEQRFRYQTVASHGDVGSYNALALYPDGRPGILYYDASRSRLMYTWYDLERESWRQEVVDDTASVGVDLDLYIDKEGREHASYRDITGLALRYAQRHPGFWQPEFVDTGSDVVRQIPEAEQCPAAQRDAAQRGVGYQSHIVVQGSTPVISYYDADCGALRLARRGAEGWTVRVLAGWEAELEGLPRSRPRTEVGRFNDLAIDPLGNLMVAFHDATQGELKLARVESGTGVVVVELIDDGLRTRDEGPSLKKLVGQMPALVVDGEGTVVVAHLDADTRKLLFATRENESWRSETLGSEAPEGFFCDAVLGPDEARYVVSVNVVRLANDADVVPIELVVLSKPSRP